MLRVILLFLICLVAKAQVNTDVTTVTVYSTELVSVTECSAETVTETVCDTITDDTDTMTEDVGTTTEDSSNTDFAECT